MVQGMGLFSFSSDPTMIQSAELADLFKALQHALLNPHTTMR